MKEWKRVVLEFILIGLVGCLLGLTANHLNYDRLALFHDYFYRTNTAKKGPAVTNASRDAIPPSDSTIAAQLEALKQRLDKHGIKLISFAEVKTLYEDPGYAAGAYILIDARDDKLYRAGHIPGAFLVDHYRIERYIPTVLDFCRAAEKIVVYCNGGECEDSEFVALDLLGEGIEPGRIFVYAQGFMDWEDQGMPVELGEQHSGEIKEASQ